MGDCPDENSRPTLSQKNAESVLREQYGIPLETIDVIKPLVSYDDQNFYVKLKPDGRELLLKITNWRDSNNIMLIGEMTELMFRLGTFVPCPVPQQTKAGSLLGRYSYSENGDCTRECIVRLFDFLPGQVMKAGEATCSQAFQWGALLGRMHLAFESMIFPTINERSFIWSWEGVPKVSQYLDAVPDNYNRSLAKTLFDKYENQMIPRMQQMKRDLLHGDMNERNVLTNSAGEVYAVLDFADCHGGPRVWDLALVLAYLSLVLPDTERDLVPYLGQAIAGYAQYMPEVVRETCDVDTLKTLICTRLCQSMVIGLQSFKVKGDPYVLATQARGWLALNKLYHEPLQNIVDVWGKLLTPYEVEIKETAS